MISKTKLTHRIKRKRNPTLVDTLREAKKHENWNKVAQKLSASSRKYASINLSQIDNETTAGDTIVVLGKVLGVGDITKKIRICAISFSESAKDKLKISKSETVLLLEEIKKNPKAEGVKVLK